VRCDEESALYAFVMPTGVMQRWTAGNSRSIVSEAMSSPQQSAIICMDSRRKDRRDASCGQGYWRWAIDQFVACPGAAVAC